MTSSLHLSKETKAFIQARVGPAGASREECSAILAALLAAPEATPFYDESRFPVALPPVVDPKE